MKTKRKQPKNLKLNKKTKTEQAFIEHVQELRKRLTFIALSVIGFSFIGYAIQNQLIGWLLQPAAQQEFIYTTPGGGIDFLFRICAYFGIAISIPVIMYQLLGFIGPVIKQQSQRFIIKACAWSGLLALAGISFGYFIGLPNAISFLSRQFASTEQIQALFTLQSYLSFVTIYLLGSALLFQIPLFMLFINRIKPLKPSRLMKTQRIVVLLAFIAAAIITPTPDIINQAIIAGPIILMYQFGIVGVWVANRGHGRVHELRKLDEAVRIERERIRQQAVIVTPLARHINEPSQARNSKPIYVQDMTQRFVLS